MGKGIQVDGDRLRRERENRALTQEELSEKSGLAVRTLRRMEAGAASKESLKRVTQALSVDPEVFLKAPVNRVDASEYLNFDLLTLEVATDLVPLMDEMYTRVGSVRRFIALELGIEIPGVRMRDSLNLSSGEYRIHVREYPFSTGRVVQGKFLAVGTRDKLKRLPGELTHDPSYGLDAKWVDEVPRDTDGVMYFCAVSVIATHLTQTVRQHAHRLLGIEDVHNRLCALEQPHLVNEVVPALISLARLRSVLQRLLQERVPIRDLALILETIADVASEDDSVDSLVESVRRALGPIICKEYAGPGGGLSAVVLEASGAEPPDAGLTEEIRLALLAMWEQGRHAILVVPPALRSQLSFPHSVILSTAEIGNEFSLKPWKRFSY